MFTFLLGGVYSAYKHFSGLDPLKLDPQALLREVTGVKPPQQLIAILPKTNLQNLTQPSIITNSKPVFKFMLVADSHNDNTNLKKSIAQVKQAYTDISFIIGLGDYSDVGTIEELKNAKVELDLSSLRYFLIPGDHDLWDCRNRSLPPNCNFREVFGPSYQSFTFNDFRLILSNNSDNYLGIDEQQLKWLSDQLEQAKNDQVKAIYVFLHEPLYHPSSDHVMGRVTSQLKTQAKSLIYQLKAAGVKKVFAGDIHYFSEYEEPETKLMMVTVGAAVTERNPQASRFAVVSVFEDGNAKVEDVEIK